MRMRSWFVGAGLVVCTPVAIAGQLVIPASSVYLPDYRDIKDVIGEADSILIREASVAPSGATT